MNRRSFFAGGILAAGLNSVLPKVSAAPSDQIQVANPEDLRPVIREEINQAFACLVALMNNPETGDYTRYCAARTLLDYTEDLDDYTT